MQNIDRQKIDIIIAGLDLAGQITGQNVTPQMVLFYYSELKDYSVQEIEEAFRKFYVEHGFSRVPTVKEITETIHHTSRQELP